MRRIHQQVERITTLVNELLDLSRIESGAVELAPEAIDLSSIDFEDTYATVQIETKKGDSVAIFTGSPIIFGITVPKIAEHPDLGVAFIEMLIDTTGQEILIADGQPPIVPADGYGNVPDVLKSLVAMRS